MRVVLAAFAAFVVVSFYVGVQNYRQHNGHISYGPSNNFFMKGTVKGTSIHLDSIQIPDLQPENIGVSRK